MDSVPRGVLWEEGLFLQPHHLQQQALTLLALTARHLAYSAPHRWGVAALEVDPLQLEHGILEVRRLELLLASGEPVIFQAGGGGNAILAPREIPKVSSARLGVFVGVRRLREHEPNVRDAHDDDLDPPRWVRATETVPDVMTGRNLVDVHFLRFNTRIFFDGDRMDGFEVVPLVQLVAPAAGLPLTRLAPDHAPPSLRIAAASSIHSAVKEVYAESAAKAAELAGGANVADVVGGSATEAEVVQLWKLQALRGALPTLREAADQGLAHPYDVYHLLAGLLGQFATLSAGAALPQLPLYDHVNPGACFDQVTKALLSLLRADQLAANYRRIPLVRGNIGIPGLAVGCQGLDPEMLAPRNQIYVVFNNPEPSSGERDWYRSGHIKVAAATRITNVVVQRQFGVPLAPCPKPRALPSRQGALYYRLQTDATSRPEAQADWSAVQRERTLVVHFASEGVAAGQAAPDLGMEAYVVFGR